MIYIEIFSALLTPIIATVAIYIAYRQHKTDALRLHHELYERRIVIYRAVNKHLSNITCDANKEYSERISECATFYAETSEASFLFDSSVQEKITEIYNKSLDLAGKHEEMHPSDGSSGVQGTELGEAARERGDLMKWHLKQLPAMKELFAKKL